MKKDLIVNYVKLSAIVILAIFLVFALRNIYRGNYNSAYYNSILYDMVNEARSKDIDNYLVENDNALVYVCASNNRKCRVFDEILRAYLFNSNYLSNNMVYLNLSDIDDTFKYLNRFSKRYDTNIKGYPTFILFNGGRVVENIYNENLDDLIKNLNDLIKSGKLGLNNE